MSDPRSDNDLLEQLAEEFLTRQRAGQQPDIAEYLDRYPELADQIGPVLRALVLLEDAAPPSLQVGSRTVASSGPPPSQLGDFRILREIGRGGMGIVYEAEQISLGRRVALKILSADPAAVPNRLARFLREARSAAKLHHTNIVPVFEVGELHGNHFYAMQFIEGQSLDAVLRALRAGRLVEGPPTNDLSVTLAQGLRVGRFATENMGSDPEASNNALRPPHDSQPVASTLVKESSIAIKGAGDSSLSTLSGRPYYTGVARLGLQAAEGLAYAHDQKVLHRDIKPANLLLDLQGTLWIADFGLAREEASDLTRAGDIVGTLRYMAPERFGGQSDVRGDIYSLGLTLYELLTLQVAFDESDQARLVQRVTYEEPVPPRQIERHIPKDLETIVLTAIAKEPRHRYQNAQALADDLRSFLEDRPIRARRSSALERTWRWCRRNPALAAACGLAAAGLIGALVLAGTLAIVETRAAQRLQREVVRAQEAERNAIANEGRAKEQEQKAKQSADESRAVIDFFRDQILSASRPKSQEGGLGREVTIRAAVDAAEPLIAKAFTGQPLAEAAIRHAMGVTYYYLDKPELAIRQLDKALSLRRTYLPVGDPDIANSVSTLGRGYQAAGKKAEAIARHKEALQLRRTYLGPDHPDSLRSMINLANAYREAGESSLSTPLFEEVLKLCMSKLGPDHHDTLNSMNNLANARRDAGRLNEAIALYEQAVRILKAKVGPEHPDTLRAMGNLAFAYQEAGRFDQAIPLEVEVLRLGTAQIGADYHDTLICRGALANCYWSTGRLDEAVSLFRENIALATAKLGPAHLTTLGNRADLGQAYYEAGRLKEAIALDEETLKLEKASLKPNDIQILTSEENLAEAYFTAGRLADSEALYVDALPRMKASLATGHSLTLDTMRGLARLYVANKQYDRAQALLAEAVAAADKRRADNPLPAADLRMVLGECYLRQNKPTDAESALRAALAARQVRDPEDWKTVWARSLLGEALLKERKFAEAEPLCLTGYQTLKARQKRIPVPERARISEARNRLVELYEAWGKKDQATLWRKKDQEAVPSQAK